LRVFNEDSCRYCEFLGGGGFRENDSDSVIEQNLEFICLNLTVI
jgi:hypothetical protein